MHNTLRTGRLSITNKARIVRKGSGDVVKEWRDGIATGVGLVVDMGPKHRTPTRSATRTDRVIPVSDNSLFVSNDGSCRESIKPGRIAPTPHAADTVRTGSTGGESNA